MTYLLKDFYLFRVVWLAALITFVVLADSQSLDAQSNHAMMGFSGSRTATAESKDVPVEWDDDTNVRWKFDLPGPGASSPIIVGDHVFVTCYSGYGIDVRKPGKVDELIRHLICIDKTTGEKVWQKEIRTAGTEDSLTRQISDHGYASSTPVSDGTNVYVFFGKAGVFAFDLNGMQLWQTSVGLGSSKFKQGSGSSPVLLDDILIVNAADEANAIIALNISDGKEVWRAESKSLDGSYTTPAIVEFDSGSKQIVVSMINEAWGLNPVDGKQFWHTGTKQEGSVVPSPVPGANTVYLFGGVGGTTYSIKANSKGNLREKDFSWKSRVGSVVSSPLLHEGHLYWADMMGIAHCINAKNGEEIYKKRLGKKAGCYASPVLANGNIYYTTRTGGVFVVPAKQEFSIAAHNVFESDSTRFDGTPAIVDDCIFLRSCKSLYCVGE